MTAPGRVRVGVGGWTYAPWRGTFFPADLTQKRELEYASGQFASIEINGTYYRTQSPETFARWHEETPDDFLFAVKGPRYTTNRRVLSEAGESIERFLTSGLSGLKKKLGPINWQFMKTKSFDADDFEGFLKLLPKKLDGLSLRHAVEVRHGSFRSPDFIALAKQYGVAIVVAGDSEYPQIADITAPFVYARIMGTQEGTKAGYAKGQLDAWAERAQAWSAGEAPEGLDYAGPDPAPDHQARDVFLYVISGHKVANPAAAMALIERLK